MFSSSDAEAVWTARAQVDHAISALAATYCARWQGSASVAAHERLAELVAVAMDLYHQLHVTGLLIEEAEAMQRGVGVDGEELAADR